MGDSTPDADDYELYVYGHSDDLIEVEGDEQAEFYANFDGPTHIMLGDTEIVAEYDGEWHFSIVDHGAYDETHKYGVGRQKVAEKLNDYTEVIVVKSPSNKVSKID